MAALYNLEPQPTAKVILHTTSGDLSLELWHKQTPLATRNFLQHCLDGYYTNTIFHRLVPGFIIQGGDPTGTGSGGISAINDGDAFQDEFHSRLKFNRRGLLGMANEGPDSNASQFFLTLGETSELTGQNTMFGRIEGDTIYNLMKMADAEMGEEEDCERPLYPTKITGAEVLVNPFEDMVVRAREAPRSLGQEGKKEVKKRKKPAGKNVLSFGGGEEGEEEEVKLVLKKAKVNPKLVAVEEETEVVKEKPAPKRRKEQKKQVEEEDVEEPAAPISKPAAKQTDAEPEDDMDIDSEPEQDHSKRNRKLDTTNAEIAALKASMKRSIDPQFKEKEKPKSALEAMIPETSTRGRKRGKAADERGAIDLFKAFKQRLETLPVDDEEEIPPAKPVAEVPATNGNNDDDAEDDEEAELCDLHFIANCQSCKSWDEGDKPDGEANGDGEDDPGWMAHKLSFAKDTLGKDLEWKRKMEEIEVIDPREKARTIKEESKRNKGKGKVGEGKR
jgi:peptidyl-prolyl cis-trans isomerase SDCCAG10